ncbi:MAG: phospholipase D-like domain-containing protein, partial [Verrucomicrobiota bacterium]
MHWPGQISEFWLQFAAGFDFIAALLASTHALLHKRDSRAAALWLGIIWLLPGLGALLYLVLGVNRIRRRALALGVHNTRTRPIPENLGEPEHDGAEHLKMLARVVTRISNQALVTGNKIEPLANGDAAFPAMLAAIEGAQKSVSLATYIFDNDASGKQFATALAHAEQRGVAVRVLVDAAGARYSWPPITRELQRVRVPFAKFLRTSLGTPWRVATINLRNHRKTLVVDGRIAFTGGMNIRQGNVLADQPKHPVQDLHFRVEGPVVTQLQETFANDWAFTTGEVLDGEQWFPELTECGMVIARVIPDGPDADFEKARLTLLAALAEAQTSVQILTP